MELTLLKEYHGVIFDFLVLIVYILFIVVCCYIIEWLVFRIGNKLIQRNYTLLNVIKYVYYVFQQLMTKSLFLTSSVTFAFEIEWRNGMFYEIECWYVLATRWLIASTVLKFVYIYLLFLHRSKYFQCFNNTMGAFKRNTV